MTFYVEDRSGFSLELGSDSCEEIFNLVAREVLDFERCPYEAEVSLTLVDADEIRDKNRQFRGIDSVTDVLSFPLLDLDGPSDFSYVEEDFPDCFNPESGELMLGDIIICSEVCAGQAERYGHSQTRELSFLIAHSMLHLLGFDHESSSDAAVMEKKQEEILSNLGILR